MDILPLGPETQAPALAFLRRSPYRNALLLSNVGQLRERCDVLLALEAGAVVGVASTYHDLPIANLLFAASRAVAAPLVAALADRTSRLRSEPVMALLPQDRFQMACEFANLLDYEIEYQMGVEPETLRLSAGPAVRLSRADLPAMNALAAAAGLTVWHESALELGPAFGCFADNALVAMAATHFATPDAIEIGHVATDPAFRRRGFASAATAALAQAALGLAPRVFLMVLEQNTAAYAVYRNLGFFPIDRFALARFTLR